MSLRNEKRRAKYAYILNLTGSSQLAQMGRGWSISRIESIYGIKVSYNDKDLNRVIKSLPQTTRAKKIRYNKYIKNKKFKQSTKDYILKKKAKIKVEKIIDKIDYDLTDVDIDIVIKKEKPLTAQQKRLEERKKSAKRESPLERGLKELSDDIKYFDYKRIYKDSLKHGNLLDTWRYWAHKENGYPAYIHEIVEAANTLNNKAIDDSYGFAVAFNMYLNNTSFEDTIKHISPDRYIPDLYDNLEYIKFVESRS